MSRLRRRNAVSGDCSGTPCLVAARVVCLAFMARLAPVLRRTLAALALAISAASAAAAPPSPQSVLGFRPGDDRQLAALNQIGAYFRRLYSASDRLRDVGEGRWNEGRPPTVAVLTSGADMAR